MKYILNLSFILSKVLSIVHKKILLILQYIKQHKYGDTKMGVKMANRSLMPLASAASGPGVAPGPGVALGPGAM